MSDGAMSEMPSTAGALVPAPASTRRGVHQLLDAIGAESVAAPGARGAAAGYRPERTLRLRVELARQLTRRRTQNTFGLLLVLPIVIAIAFEFSSSSSGSGGGGALVDLATSGAGNFALFTEFASVGFLLVVVVALFCGDTVAGEASWSSLRYLLAIPVPRARLLRAKLAVALLLSLVANVMVPAWSYVVGGLFFGWAPVRSPLGGSLPFSVAATKLAIIVGYVVVSSLVVAALAFLLSVSTDAPLAAVGGAVLLVVLSNILDSITALGSVRNWLPTHFQYSWLDALQTPVVWTDMSRGAAVSVGYAAVLLAAAFWHFGRKDITS